MANTKHTWIIIRRIYSVEYGAKEFVKCMESKFPNIKFKQGKTTIKQTITGPDVTTSIMGFLPTPHPNDTAREVIQYARSLIENVTWTQN